MTEPGGKVARSSSASDTPSRQLARHIRNEMPYTRMLLGPPQLGHRNAPVAADPPEIVAHEIDDHQVLRPVLRRAEQLRALVRGRALTPAPFP